MSKLIAESNSASNGRATAPSTRVTAALFIMCGWYLALQTDDYQQLILTLIAVHAIVGAGLVLLVGAAGQFSLGQAAFVAVGAYAAATFATTAGIGLPLEIAAAIVIAIGVGIVVGLPSLRLSGLLLAVATLALGYSVQSVLYNWKSLTGGSDGKVIAELHVFGEPIGVTSAAFIFMGLSFLIVQNLLEGKTGRALHALRTSDVAARSVGIDVGRQRVIAFAVSAALTAVGGVLLAHSVQHVSPEYFSMTLSINLVVMVLIGGQRRLLGALLGAAFVIGLPQQFRDIQKYEGLLYGSILLACMLYAPGGLVDIFDRIRLQAMRALRRTASMQDYDLKNALVRAAVGNRKGVTTGFGDKVNNLSQIGLSLRVTNVSVRFGGVLAVNNVSLDVAQGEVLGLIGPNGAGKTTLFNALSGFVRTEGSIQFGSTELTSLSVRHRALSGVARTFQNLALHGGLTVLDHVLIGRDRYFGYGFVSEMLRGSRAMQDEAAGRMEALSLLTALGLEGVADMIVEELPYGLQKRVDVARALASRPRLLLLDEPSAGLPHYEADEFIDQVLGLVAPNGTSVVIIEHNVGLVRRVCSRIVVLSAGAVIASGPSSETLQSREVIEAYLGS